jgi:hypothetical protein
MLTAVVCSGGVVLLLLARSRWWHWALAALLPTLVAVVLMISVLHWASDVVGGALLGMALVAASASVGIGRPSVSGPSAPAAPRGRGDVRQS